MKTKLLLAALVLTGLTACGAIHRHPSNQQAQAAAAPTQCPQVPVCANYRPAQKLSFAAIHSTAFTF